VSSVRPTPLTGVRIFAAPGVKIRGMFGLRSTDHDVEFHGLDFEGVAHVGNSTPRVLYNILAYGASRVKVWNCTFTNHLPWQPGQDTINVWLSSGCTDWHIADCHSLDTGADMLHSYGSDGVLVQDCTARWTEAKLWTIGGQVGYIGENFCDLKRADNWVFVRCTVDGPNRSKGAYVPSEVKPGEPVLFKTSGASEGIIAHKAGARNVKVLGCEFRGVRTGVKISNSRLGGNLMDTPTDNWLVERCVFDPAGHASWSQGADTAIEISSGSTVSGLTPGAPHVRLDGNTFLPGWRENITVAGGSGRFPTVTGADAL